MKKTVLAYLAIVFLSIISCDKESTNTYSEDIIGWWEWDIAADSGVRFMENGSACFWDEDSTGDTFGWWLEGNILCSREWAPGDKGTPSDGLCSWTGNPNCNCFKEGGKHVTTIIKLTETELIIKVDDDKAYDSDYDMPSQIKFTRLKGIK